MAGLNNNDRKNLKEIKEATAGIGYAFKLPADMAKLIEHGLVEINHAMSNPANPAEFAVRSINSLDAAASTPHITSSETATTSDGNVNMSDVLVASNEVVGAEANGAGAAAVGEAKAKRVMPKLPAHIEVVSGDEAPEPPANIGKRGGAGRSTFYPFNRMEAGTAFFVANDAEANRPDALKSMGTTVSGANRAAKKDGSGKKFIAYAGAGKLADGTVVNGAWVKRID